MNNTRNSKTTKMLKNVVTIIQILPQIDQIKEDSLHLSQMLDSCHPMSTENNQDNLKKNNVMRKN